MNVVRTLVISLVLCASSHSAIAGPVVRGTISKPTTGFPQAVNQGVVPNCWTYTPTNSTGGSADLVIKVPDEKVAYRHDFGNDVTTDATDKTKPGNASYFSSMKGPSISLQSTSDLESLYLATIFGKPNGLNSCPIEVIRYQVQSWISPPLTGPTEGPWDYDNSDYKTPIKVETVQSSSESAYLCHYHHKIPLSGVDFEGCPDCPYHRIGIEVCGVSGASKWDGQAAYEIRRQEDLGVRILMFDKMVGEAWKFQFEQ
ncbi:MAG TPA: hypothetical protein VLJ37_00470 [bacterium]|nr:hypothetical protein [bacterium]